MHFVGFIIRIYQCWVFIMGTDFEDFILEGRYAKSTGKHLQTFRNSVLPSRLSPGLLGPQEEGITFLRIICNFQLVKAAYLLTRLNVNNTEREPQTAT